MIARQQPANIDAAFRPLLISEIRVVVCAIRRSNFGICCSILGTRSSKQHAMTMSLHQHELSCASLITQSFSLAALVGSLTVGATFFFSPVSGILVDKLGLRTTTLLGGILCTCGMLLSSFYTGELGFGRL